MKIALTGHTKGIGKAIKDVLEPENTVIGFSRTNGFNINNPQAIFDIAKDCDVFVNNAQYKDYQTQLFELFGAENTKQLLILTVKVNILK